MSDENIVPEGVTYTQLRDNYNTLREELEKLSEQRDKLTTEKDVEPATLETADAEFNAKVVEVDNAWEKLQSKEARDRARAQFKPIPTGTDRIAVREPDMYVDGGRSFMSDLYQAQVQQVPEARNRIEKHQRLEIEKRAMASSALGGIIPPQYLVDLYAKASRNGRVFADQCNGQTLPDVGMSLIVPRITTATTAGSQSAENAALNTQDAAETDLTVNVRTLGGYVPVSRQGIERAAYSDEILFEDLIARYWAALDTQAINGSGGTQLPGLLGTAGIATSTTATATVAAVWPKIADVIQQINGSTGGLGYVADKIVMHPRRWGFFEAALDSQNRPVFGISGQPAFNVVGMGDSHGYGLVGRMHGLDVYTDANVPTNLGTNTNEDRIIIFTSSIVHLWERQGDPVTLSFEQQAGTSLQVQLIAYGYVAFTAGRYPASCGVVSGAGLVTPTF
jgi:HK97 family phage major capsid protein